MFAMAAVSVSSKMSADGSIPASAMRCSVKAARSRSPIDLPERLISSSSSRAGGRVLGDQRDGLPHHPAVDRLDHVEALGHVEEGAGHQELAAASSRRRTSSSYWATAPVLEAQDRLGVEHEAVIGERSAQIARPRRAGRCDGGGPRRAVDDMRSRPDSLASYIAWSA